MKNHAQFAQALATYRDLSESDRREVDRHIQGCSTCAARLAAYQTMDRDMARLVDPQPDRWLREGFYTVVESHDQRAGWFTGVSQQLAYLPALTGRVLELAALVLLIAGLAWVVRGQLQPPIASVATTPAPDTASDSLISKVDQDFATGSGQAIDSMGAGGLAPSLAGAKSIGEAARPASSHGFSAAQAALAQNEQEEGMVYVVQLDDTLWKLAEKYLGDGSRYGEIIEATHLKRAEDPSFALIEDPNRIVPGSKLWIPAAGSPGPSAALALAAQVPAATPKPVATPKGPGGHIAFSFWNDHPARCTYEINVIDVGACLTSPEACQANRRIFSLNNVSEPALSPQGDRLAFRGWGDPPSEDSPYLNCAPALKARYLANTTLEGTQLTGTGGFWEDSHPDWSPDGNQILFDSGRNGDGIIRILLINADGSNERDLRIAGQQPSWAPDGQRFVFRGCDTTGNRCGLWLAYAAPVNPWETGANLIAPVALDDQAAHPDWSPVSDQIVYQSPQSGSWDLYLADAGDAGGSPLQQLTKDASIEGLPAWSPDGQWVAYLSNAGGNWGIWIVRADGSQRHLLFSFDGGIFSPKPVEPYGQRDWIDEQISWSK